MTMARRTRRWLAAWLLASATALGLAGCAPDAPTDHGHAHDNGASAEHGADEAEQAHGDDESLVYTHYTASTELFVEFPPLVAGRASRFAAHLTRLSDYAPLSSGTLDVILQQGGKTMARFRVNKPARTGIFAPEVTPRDPGEFELVIAVRDGELEARHELGPVRVFAPGELASVQQPELEGEIGYLKEQQWANPFATVIAQARDLRASVPGFATVMAPADAGAEIRAPSDGFFANTGLVRAGATVKAGETLGFLVPRLGGETDFGQLLVAMERARSGLTLARRDLERLQGLFEQGAIPERRLLDARGQLEVALAEHRTAQSRVEQHQQGNADAGIALRTPVAGEVVEVTARPGGFVRAGDRVFRVAAPERRWVEIRVAEYFAAQLRDASGAWFDDQDRQPVVLDAERGARVVQTGTAVDPLTRTASITVEYPSEFGPSVIGSRFSAHVFTSAPRRLLAIPRSAVIDDGGRDVVYLQTGGESFTRRTVDLGIVDGDYVEVRQGVQAGDRVVSAGAYFVKLAATGGEEIGHGHAH